MDGLNKKIITFAGKVKSAQEHLEIAEKQKKLDELSLQMSQKDFWSNSSRAQKVSQQHSKLQKQTKPWVELLSKTNELIELSKMNDESLTTELDEQFKTLEKEYEALEGELKFGGPYDDYNVVMTLQAGAGGTDAQDWAEMLRRMYLRWAQKVGVDVKLIEESKGDEAGIKSATLLLNGTNIYGRLKNEHGVHRLVRKSPFNSAGSRETSFAMVEVLPQIETPEDVDVEDKDLRIDVFRAGGHGGQSVNTTDSAVRITHIPTGVVVSIQNEKSQIQNRETAMKILMSRLTQLQLEQQKEKISELRGPNKEVAWGNQIRNYVLHPYTLVKDSRSGFETTDVDGVLDGDLDEIINAGLSLG